MPTTIQPSAMIAPCDDCGTPGPVLNYIAIGWMRRFWAKVDTSNGPDACWLWKACKQSGGYGQFWPAKGHATYAHRLSYTLAYGPIHNGLHVLHSCDVPACVNPAHLSLGTMRDNLQDAVRKGRTAKGDRSGARLHIERIKRGADHGNAKLTEDQVREIRAKYAAGASQPELARQYNVWQTAISKIVCRRVWRHI